MICPGGFGLGGLGRLALGFPRGIPVAGLLVRRGILCGRILVPRVALMGAAVVDDEAALALHH